MERTVGFGDRLDSEGGAGKKPDLLIDHDIVPHLYPPVAEESLQVITPGRSQEDQEPTGVFYVVIHRLQLLVQKRFLRSGHDQERGLLGDFRLGG